MVPVVFGVCTVPRVTMDSKEKHQVGFLIMLIYCRMTSNACLASVLVPLEFRPIKRDIVTLEDKIKAYN